MKLIGGHSKQISDLVFSPDSSLLASSALDGSLAVWKLDTREQLVLFQAPNKSCCCVTFAPVSSPVVVKGQRRQSEEGGLPTVLPAVVAGYSDGTVRVFDVGKPKMLRKMQPHAEPVKAVRCFNDGKFGV